MNMLCMGFLAGAICTLMILMIGGLNGMDKDTHNGHSDSTNNIGVACGADRGDSRRDTDMETALSVLATYRIGATGTEKRGIDYATECIYKVDRILEYMEGKNVTV